MKIIKILKNKTGYTLELENKETLEVLEDTIIKHRLLVGHEINYTLLKQIDKDEQEGRLYSKAIKYLSIRMRSKKEMSVYLKKHSSNYQPVIDRLETEGYLDEAKFTEAFITDKFHLTNYGPNKIKHELNQLGIPSETIEDKITRITLEDEIEKLTKIIEKKIKSNRKDSVNFLKKRIMSAMILLGYHNSAITQVLDNVTYGCDQEILNTEYRKIKNRLSRKYKGEELKRQIKTKLYQLGFDTSKIE